MESMIERAARALCKYPDEPRQNGEPMWTVYIPAVRLVLTAIRESNDAMDEAGATEVDRGNPYDRDVAGNIWMKMIDTALAS